MQIERNGEVIELTEDEVMNAYMQVDKQMKMDEAKLAFTHFVDAMFEKAYGLTYSGATDKDSADCILGDLVSEFVKQHDPTVPEKTTWETIVKSYMDARRIRGKENRDG